MSVNIHMKYVQKQIVAERTSTKITPPLTSFIIGDFKAYGGKFSDKYVKFKTYPIFTHRFNLRLRDHIRGMKGIKYVERNDRNEMRSERVSLDQGIGKTLFPTAAQQKRNKNVGIASCYTQPNCPAWVSGEDYGQHVGCMFYRPIPSCGARGLFGLPADLVPHLTIMNSMVRK